MVVLNISKADINRFILFIRAVYLHNVQLDPLSCNCIQHHVGKAKDNVGIILAVHYPIDIQ